MGGDIFVTTVVGILKGLSYIYDVVLYIPWYIYDRPDLRLKTSRRIRARPVYTGEPGSPFRTVDSFETLTTSLVPKCSTINELWERAVKLYGDKDCVGARELLNEENEVQPNGKVFKKDESPTIHKTVVLGDYNWLSYNNVNEQARDLGYGLLSLGQKPKQNICLLAETRSEWMIAAQACFKCNFPIVTLYATLGEEAIAYGINEAEVTHVIISGELLPKIKNVLKDLPTLRHLIYMENHGRPDLSDYSDSVQVHSMKAVIDMGRQPQQDVVVVPPAADDLAVIMYTSGSTGLPKGVLITHANLCAGMSGQCQRVADLGKRDDTYIGYLPLAHVLELSAELSCLFNGVRIGYSSPQTLSDQSSKIKKGTKGDATVLKPTLMTAVPVIMERLYKAVWEKVNSGGKIARAIFIFTYEYKKRHLKQGFPTPMCDKLIFSKTRTTLGGSVRQMLSGGAPLSSDTQEFMNICFCCPVGQGYGLTETCGAGTMCEVNDLSTGHVGAPLQCCEFMLVDWIEGGYTSRDLPCPRGEILIGGGNVAQGYYKHPEKSALEFKTINGVRYFCTGDIGEFQKNGCLKIIDRKKDLVKLAHGEYVSLSKVETYLKLCPLVENLCVYADPTKLFTVALIVPNHKNLQQIAAQIGVMGIANGHSEGFSNGHVDDEEGAQIQWKTICSSAEVEQAVLKQLQQFAAKKTKLQRFEIPMKICLCTELWTPDTGLVTEALKLKRRNIQTHYQSDINRMYS